MHGFFRHKLLIGVTVAALAVLAGGAYAASQSGSTSRQAFLNDVAKRLNVSPAQLRAALKGAYLDRINAAVKAGTLTQAQANALEQRINQGGAVPFLFAAPVHGPFGQGGLRFHLFGGRSAGGQLGPVGAAAGYLGLTRAQLASDLASGKSLAQIASSRGKSVSGLEQAISGSLKTRLDRAVSAGAITKSQEQRILSGISAALAAIVNHTLRGPGALGPHRVFHLHRLGAGVPPALFAPAPGPAGTSPPGTATPPASLQVPVGQASPAE